MDKICFLSKSPGFSLQILQYFVTKFFEYVLISLEVLAYLLLTMQGIFSSEYVAWVIY